MCLKKYQLDPCKHVLAPGLAWQAALKKNEINLELLTEIDMLLRFEKGIRWRICNTFHPYAKANKKYVTDYEKNEE